MKRFLIGMMFLLTSSTVSYCQQYIAGYIINHQGDTLKGEIRFESHKEVSVQKGEETQILKVNDAKKIVLSDNRAFVSTVLDSVFTETLVEGHLGLYRYKDLYLLTEANKGVGILGQKREVIREGGSEYIKNSEKWKGVLFHFTSDCSESFQLVRDAKFGYHSFTRIVISYNETCSNSDYTFIHEGTPKIKILPQLRFGYTRQKMTDADLPSYLISNLTSGPSIGIGFFLIQPRSSNGFFWESGIFYSKIEDKGVSSVTRTFSETLIDYQFEINRLTVPLMLGKDLHANVLAFRIKGGFEYNLNLSKYLRENKEIIMSSGTIYETSEDNDPFDRKSFLALSAGLDMLIPSNNFEWGVGINFSRGLMYGNLDQKSRSGFTVTFLAIYK